MAILEPAKVGGTREDGSTILLPEVEVVVKNLKTDTEYDDDDAAQADVDDPATETTAEDIQRSTTIRVLKGVGGEGASG
jgi:hypothetical protein